MFSKEHADVWFLGDVLPCSTCSVGVPGNAPAVINLECPITKSPTPAQGKIVLKAEEDWLTLTFGKRRLVACLANNHIMDYGLMGISDTIALLDSKGIPYFGAGLNATGMRNAVVLNIGGRQIGFCGYVCPSTNPIFATENSPGVSPIDISTIRANLNEIRAKGADRAVVCLHWGAEEVPYPKPQDVVLARQIITLGADLLIGHHSHCIQPYEVRKSGAIFYSLGNAIMPDLDLASYYGPTHLPLQRFVKRQRRWNRLSLAVGYSIASGMVQVHKLYFNGASLTDRGRESFWRAFPRCWLRSETIYRAVQAYSRLRSMFLGFLDRPRLPSVAHFKSLFRMTS